MNKTSYEMRMSDCSSDVCSSDLGQRRSSGAPRLIDQRIATRTMAPDCLDASAMPKEHASSETIEEGLRHDVLWLLITVYSYVTRRRFEGLGKMSREAFVVDCILLESAARDIVGVLPAAYERRDN